MAFYNGVHRGSIFTSTLHTKNGRIVPIETLPDSGGLGLDPSGSIAAHERLMAERTVQANEREDRLMAGLERVRRTVQGLANETAQAVDAMIMEREPTDDELERASRFLDLVSMGERAAQSPDELAILFGNNEIDRFIDPIDLD
jgi:hypothetical protein